MRAVLLRATGEIESGEPRFEGDPLWQMLAAPGLGPTVHALVSKRDEHCMLALLVDEEARLKPKGVINLHATIIACQPIIGDAWIVEMNDGELIDMLPGLNHHYFHRLFNVI